MSSVVSEDTKENHLSSNSTLPALASQLSQNSAHQSQPPQVSKDQSQQSKLSTHQNQQPKLSPYQNQPPQNLPPLIYSLQDSPKYIIPSTPVVLMQPLITKRHTFEQCQVQTICPNCGAKIITTTKYVSGMVNWMMCMCLLLCGFFFGCCLIPFCMNNLKDVVHSCPFCKIQIGRWNRL